MGDGGGGDGHVRVDPHLAQVAEGVGHIDLAALVTAVAPRDAALVDTEPGLGGGIALGPAGQYIDTGRYTDLIDRRPQPIGPQIAPEFACLEDRAAGTVDDESDRAAGPQFADDAVGEPIGDR